MLCFLSFFVTAAENDVSDEEIELNIKNVQSFLSMNREVLPYEEVVSLASVIIQQRKYYTSNIVAKAYLLLAEAATNKGDVSRAFQFAQDGLSTANIDRAIQMNLMIKVAAGYYVKGKFNLVLDVSENVILLANQQVDIQYRLLALAYKAMAHALLSEHVQAFDTLNNLQQLITQHNQYSDDIELLEILAVAYHYLGDYQTAVTLHQKLLKLRIELSQNSHLEKTYADLAGAYMQLGQLDNAYHAYWQANRFAEEVGSSIQIAYAQLGLGQVLLLQNNNDQAYKALSRSISLFQGQNLTKPYISALISLAKASLATSKTEQGYELLQQASLLAENIVLTSDQIDLYYLLSQMYETQGQLKKSLTFLHKYIQLHQAMTESQKASALAIESAKQKGKKSRQLALELAEKSELRADFTEKFEQQKSRIDNLLIIITLLSLFILWTWFKRRAQKMSNDYDEVDKPAHQLSSPAQTKLWYQNAYKMARKYEYPIAIGYLSIQNWSEMNAKFSDKTINEVVKTIAILINEYNGEFNYAGTINEGEYLFLAPYLTNEDMKEYLDKITQAFELRFFANLGDFSIITAYAYDTPSVQDIDPYIFLSRLSGSVDQYR